MNAFKNITRLNEWINEYIKPFFNSLSVYQFTKNKKLLYFKNKYNDFRVDIPFTERPEKYINLSKEPIINIRYPLSQKSR